MAETRARHSPGRPRQRDGRGEHQRTFEAFIRFWVYVFGVAALVLIFLAIFNT